VADAFAAIEFRRLPVKSFVLALILVASATFSLAANGPRVFVTDSKSWEISGGTGGTADGFGGAARGGARPQTAEIIKTFNERCPLVTVNSKQEKADYVILLDHEGGKELISRDNKVVVFNHDGDAILSRSTRSLGNAVKDACAAITRDWPRQRAKRVNSEGNGETASSGPKPD
jgi:hypothetical protein